MKTRSFRDILVENVLFGHYSLSDCDVDKELVQKILLQEPSEDVVVKSFYFNISGIDGFAIVSNDSRVGSILYSDCDDVINKQEKEEFVVESVSKKLDELKSILLDITLQDCDDVLKRGYNYTGDIRGFFDFDWVWKVETTTDECEGRIYLIGDYIGYPTFASVFSKERDAAVNFNSVVNISSNDNAKEVLIKNNKNGEMPRYQHFYDGSVFNSYLPYKGSNSFFAAEREKGSPNPYSILPVGTGYKTLNPQAYMRAMDAMLINKSPVFTYTYINKAGEKKNNN